MLCFIIQPAFLSCSTRHLYQAQQAHPAFHRLPDSVGHSLPAILTDLETFTAAQPGTNWTREHAFSLIPSNARGFLGHGKIILAYQNLIAQNNMG